MFDKQITLFDTKAPTEAHQFSEADLKDLKGSITPNTKRAYAGHLHRLFEFAGSAELTDTTLRDFCHHLERQGKSPATISQAIAAAVFWAKIHNTPSPAGDLTDRAIKRIRRESTKSADVAKHNRSHWTDSPPSVPPLAGLASEPSAALNPGKPPSAAAHLIRRLPACCFMPACAVPKLQRSPGATSSQHHIRQTRC